MKKFVQTLYDYRYTATKAYSSDEEPEKEICFSVEEVNVNEISRKKTGDVARLKAKTFLRPRRSQND